jgi:hypothetical protein
MKKLFISLALVVCSNAFGHIPVLLLPLKGTPIASYFIGNFDVSRAIYSELTEPHDFFVAQFYVKKAQVNTIEILTPVCLQVPSSEFYQPSVLILKGDLPWKKNGETDKQFINRLQKIALGTAESHYKKGERPQFFEDFGKQYYWVGGKLRLSLKPGLYALVVFNNDSNKGNFTLGINEKENWTPDLYKYVSELLPKISAGICDPKGFTGLL